MREEEKLLRLKLLDDPTTSEISETTLPKENYQLFWHSEESFSEASAEYEVSVEGQESQFTCITIYDVPMSGCSSWSHCTAGVVRSLPPRDAQKGKHLSEITQAWSVKAKIQNLTQSTGSFFCYSLLLSLQVYWWKLLLPLNSFFLGGCPFALDCPRQIRRKLHTCSFRRKSTLALRLQETTKSRHQPTQMIPTFGRCSLWNGHQLDVSNFGCELSHQELAVFFFFFGRVGWASERRKREAGKGRSL